MAPLQHHVIPFTPNIENPHADRPSAIISGSEETVKLLL